MSFEDKRTGRREQKTSRRDKDNKEVV